MQLVEGSIYLCMLMCHKAYLTRVINVRNGC